MGILQSLVPRKRPLQPSTSHNLQTSEIQRPISTTSLSSAHSHHSHHSRPSQSSQSSQPSPKRVRAATPLPTRLGPSSSSSKRSESPLKGRISHPFPLTPRASLERDLARQPHSHSHSNSQSSRTGVFRSRRSGAPSPASEFGRSHTAPNLRAASLSFAPRALGPRGSVESYRTTGTNASEWPSERGLAHRHDGYSPTRPTKSILRSRSEGEVSATVSSSTVSPSTSNRSLFRTTWTSQSVPIGGKKKLRKIMRVEDGWEMLRHGDWDGEEENVIR